MTGDRRPVAERIGGELGLSYRLDSNWKTDASLAYAWGKNSSDGEALPPGTTDRLSFPYALAQRAMQPQGHVRQVQRLAVGPDPAQAVDLALAQRHREAQGIVILHRPPPALVGRGAGIGAADRAVVAEAQLHPAGAGAPLWD